MLRVAVIYEKNTIYIEWTPDKFVKLLEKYTTKYGSITAAMKRIETEIKEETRTS